MATWKGTSKSSTGVAPIKIRKALQHKTYNVFKMDVETEEDQTYASACERFLKFQAQLNMVLHHTATFRKTMEEALQQAVELADDFGRISAGQGGSRSLEPWAHKAGGQAFFLKSMLEESVVSLRKHLCDDMDDKAMRALQEAANEFAAVQAQMLARREMKIEMLHYSNKVQELKDKQKATDERKDRNKEKYAQASQALRDQTNQLMAIFAHAEQVRRKLLTEDLPTVILAEKNSFDALAINLNKAAAEAVDGEPRPPRMSDAARTPHREMPPSDFPTTPTDNNLAEVSLGDTSPTSEPPPAYSSPYPVKVEPPAAEAATPTIVKKRSPLPVSPKGGGAPWSSSNGGGEFGEELKRAQEHQHSKLAADSAAAATASMNTADTVASNDRSAAADEGTPAAVEVEKEDAGPPGHVTEPDDPDHDHAHPPVAEDGATAPLADDPSAAMAQLPPGKVRLRALYDYDATQEGDLSFRAGDMIITDGGAFSGDGWVSGECSGSTGIFPANYTEPW